MNVPQFVVILGFFSVLLVYFLFFCHMNCVQYLKKLAVGILELSCRHLFILYMSLARCITVGLDIWFVFSNCMLVNKNVFLQAEHFIPDRRPDKRRWGVRAKAGPEPFSESSVIWTEASEVLNTHTRHVLSSAKIRCTVKDKDIQEVWKCIDRWSISTEFGTFKNFNMWTITMKYTV